MRRIFTLCLALFAGITMLSAQQIIADGGLNSAKAPRNTVASLEAAAKAGHSVKCDVNLLTDGTIVVVEGPWLGEKGDPDRMNIQRSDYAMLSSKLLANGEAVPTLDSYLDKVAELPEPPPSSRLEGLRLLYGLETSLSTSLQTPQEA